MLKSKNSLIITVLIILLILTSCGPINHEKITSSIVNINNFDQKIKINTLIKDSGDIEMLFCPNNDCVKKLTEFINKTNYTLDCAFFELSHPKIVDSILNIKNKGVNVRIVLDNDYRDRFNYSFVKQDKSGYMHNKFCIKDKQKMFTGSANPTINGLEKNDNNIVFINSNALISNYQNEFEELWEGIFKKGNKTLNQNILINNNEFGKIKISNYFCPEDKCVSKVDEILKDAKKEVKFMTFTFTHDDLINTLLVKNMEGVKIEGIVEARMIHNSPHKVFNYQNISVLKDSNGNTMHHKVFIIDQKIVITGSFNPSKNGNENNDENILIIENEEIAKTYLKEFERVYSKGK